MNDVEVLLNLNVYENWTKVNLKLLLQNECLRAGQFVLKIFSHLACFKFQKTVKFIQLISF